MALSDGTQLGLRNSLAPFVCLLTGLVLVTACGSDSETMSGPTAPSRTLSLGETIPLGDTVRIQTSGDYPLPDGATSLRTRCTGSVTVMFTADSGSESNTCESAGGSANQTNNVTGATLVTFQLGPGAFADVTLS